MNEASPQLIKLHEKHLQQYHIQLHPRHFYYIISQRLLHEVHIHGIPNIKRAFAKEIPVKQIDPTTGGLITTNEWIIETEGTNYQAILQLPEVVGFFLK